MMGAFFQECHQMLRLQQTAGSLLFDAAFWKFRNLGQDLGEGTSLRFISVRTRAKVGASRQK